MGLKCAACGYSPAGEIDAIRHQSTCRANRRWKWPSGRIPKVNPDDPWEEIARRQLGTYLAQLVEDFSSLVNDRNEARKLVLTWARNDYHEHMIDAFVEACERILDRAERDVATDGAVEVWGPEE